MLTETYRAMVQDWYFKRRELVVDPPKRTLVPRVQLTTAADEVAGKRCGVFLRDLFSASQISFRLKRKCISNIRWAIHHLIAVELSRYLLDGTILSHVPKVGAPRRHRRGDKLIVVFQFAGMFLCSGLRDDVGVSEVRRYDVTLADTLVYIRRSAAKDKGKGKMDESEPVQTKIKLQQEQERLGYEAAVRLQAKLVEEDRQRITSVHESASSFNIEEWEDIQARIQADEELAQRIHVKEREKYTEAE
ncbi:hypothetical protein Tco_1163594 [Tanacetum coccineum]